MHERWVVRHHRRAGRGRQVHLDQRAGRPTRPPRRPGASHQRTIPSPLGDLARHAPEHYRGLTLACLVAADRYWHLETGIHPHLAAGEVVVSDRYVPTSMVLQRIDGVDLDFLWQLNAYAPRPDLAVILRADPAVLAARLAARGPHTRFERAPGASQVESRLYQQAAERLEAAGWSLLTVDSTRVAPEEIATTVLARILTLRETLQPR